MGRHPVDCGQDRLLVGTLRHSVRAVERNTGRRPGLTTEERQQPKALEKENERLRRAVSDLTLAKQILAEAARGNC